jgi:hypothetical protein
LVWIKIICFVLEYCSRPDDVARELSGDVGTELKPIMPFQQIAVHPMDDETTKDSKEKELKSQSSPAKNKDTTKVVKIFH